MALYRESMGKASENDRDNEHHLKFLECSECDRLRAECDQLMGICKDLENELRLQNDRHMSKHKERILIQDFDGTIRMNPAAFRVMDDRKRAMLHAILSSSHIPKRIVE